MFAYLKQKNTYLYAQICNRRLNRERYVINDEELNQHYIKIVLKPYIAKIACTESLIQVWNNTAVAVFFCVKQPLTNRNNNDLFLHHRPYFSLNCHRLKWLRKHFKILIIRFYEAVDKRICPSDVVMMLLALFELFAHNKDSVLLVHIDYYKRLYHRSYQ